MNILLTGANWHTPNLLHRQLLNDVYRKVVLPNSSSELRRKLEPLRWSMRQLVRYYWPLGAINGVADYLRQLITREL